MTARGIGGIFFKSQDPKALSAWYERHLGLASDGDGVIFGWRDYYRPERVCQTIWSPFKKDTTYFQPSEASWMINFRVENLKETLERLRSEDVEVFDEIEESTYGNFGWIMDPEGNKIELWEPPITDPSPPSVPIAEPEGLTGVWACPPGTTIAAAADLRDLSIEKERVVDASPEELWRLWTTSSGMAEWWAASNQIELRVGGPMELYFLADNAEGLRGSDGCRILSFLPNRMLSFTWNSPPNLDYTRPRHTHVVLEFEANGEGKSRVRLTHLGWPMADWNENSQWQETFDYFDIAWDRVLDLLVDHLKSK